jgi:U3 small nucleolar RNA-associated protein 14
VDEEFWKLQTWEESTSDQEWVPGDEDISSTSSMNETSEETSEDSSSDQDQKEDHLLKVASSMVTLNMFVS